MKKLIFFLIPLLSYGQCDIEILGFDPISTDIMMVVNGGACCTESDSIGEFILALGFNPRRTRVLGLAFRETGCCCSTL